MHKCIQNGFHWCIWSHRVNQPLFKQWYLVELYTAEQTACIFWVTVVIRTDRLQTLQPLPLFVLSDSPFPPLPSSTFDANYTICPPSISWDRTMPFFSLLTFTHYWVYWVHTCIWCYCLKGVPPGFWQSFSLAACLLYLMVSKYPPPPDGGHGGHASCNCVWASHKGFKSILGNSYQQSLKKKKKVHFLRRQSKEGTLHWTWGSSFLHTVSHLCNVGISEKPQARTINHPERSVCCCGVHVMSHRPGSLSSCTEADSVMSGSLRHQTIYIALPPTWL